MGNSGSVQHMQPGLKELHSYHQIQTNGDDGDGHGDFLFHNKEPAENFQEHFLERGVLDKSLHRRSQFSRIPSSSNRLNQINATATDVKNSHIKVLPSLNENLKLRSTTNGAILQSGGTISGRRESLLHQPLERSRTFITETSEECLKNNASRMMMNRRSQTQLSIDLRKKGCIRNEVPEQNVHYKRFSSNLDLRSMINDNLENDPNASVCNSSESYQKLSKVKIKNKKRKAPPVPLEIPLIAQPNIDFDRKQRLFRTKNETTVQGSTTNQSKPKPMSSKPSEQLDSPVLMRSTYKSNLLNPGFRREKSFDAKLLSSMSRNVDQLHREGKPTTDTNKRKSFQVARTTSPMAKPVKNSDSYFKEKEDKSDLKMELEASSKFRLMLTKNSTNARDSKPRQREPNHAKPKLLSPSAKVLKPETQSKIPQLKKTFYFGMESSKLKPSAKNIGDSSQKIVNLLSSSYDEEKLLKDEIVLDKHLTTLSKDNDPVYTLNHKYDTETNDNGIQVNVRPTLPRRQLEIPRFSPVAAWRTLSEEYRKQLNNVDPTASNMPDTSSNIEATNSFLIEDRIHRTYREPGSFYPDNKSGDSGISGDDGYIVEKPIQPRNIVQGLQPDCCDELANLENSYPVMQELVPSPMKVVGPFLKPWTPQQDLEEEESSSDGGGDIALKQSESQSPTSPHVFSLSLPRESQLSVYGEKNKPDFRSLQKLKRTASGDLNGSNFDCNQSSNSHTLDGVDVCLGNYRSDNWVLSKTAMTMANTPAPLNNEANGCHQNTKGSSYFDMSISIQPMSLGSLATGKHVMYLPNRRPSDNELKRQPVGRSPNTNLLNNRESMMEESFCKNISIPTRNKRFSFQSSVRQIERRRLSEKLSKEADQKEALRKSELEAMRRVEEEFQRKRAYEKASIRHQLRLYSMDDDNFSSLPNLSGLRAEPDGAVSSASESPVLQINARRNFKYHSSNRVSTSNDLAMIFANS